MSKSKTISVEFTKQELEKILSYFQGDYKENAEWIFKIALAHDKLRANEKENKGGQPPTI
jgi:hypothetical protein